MSQFKLFWSSENNEEGKCSISANIIMEAQKFKQNC